MVLFVVLIWVSTAEQDDEIDWHPRQKVEEERLLQVPQSDKFELTDNLEAFSVLVFLEEAKDHIKQEPDFHKLVNYDFLVGLWHSVS